MKHPLLSPARGLVKVEIKAYYRWCYSGYNMAKHKSGSRKRSNPRRKPQKSQTPTSGVTTASSHDTKLPSAVKTSCSVKATIVTTQVEKPKRKWCPACGEPHIATGSNDNPRLSDCKTFISKPVEERAEVIAATGNGCVICLDYSGSHRARSCQAKDEQGKKFEPCMQQVKNGSP